MWIFLDIDGVLVAERKFDRSVNQEKPELLKFSPDCLQEFENVLHRYPNALVVISSSWREVFPFEIVRSLFSPSIAKQVVGFTPFLQGLKVHQFHYVRHQEVLEYLRQNNALKDPWVAIDDIPEHYPPDVSVVVTDRYNGFDRDAALALEMYLLSE